MWKGCFIGAGGGRALSVSNLASCPQEGAGWGGTDTLSVKSQDGYLEVLACGSPEPTTWGFLEPHSRAQTLEHMLFPWPSVS